MPAQNFILNRLKDLWREGAKRSGRSRQDGLDSNKSPSRGWLRSVGAGPWLMGLDSSFEGELRHACYPSPRELADYKRSVKRFLESTSGIAIASYRLWSSELLPSPLLVLESTDIGVEAGSPLATPVYGDTQAIPAHILVDSTLVGSPEMATTILEHQAVHLHLAMTYPRPQVNLESEQAVADLFTWHMVQELAAGYLTHQNTTAHGWSPRTGVPSDRLDIFPYLFRIACAQGLSAVLRHLGPENSDERRLASFLTAPMFLAKAIQKAPISPGHRRGLAVLIKEQLPAVIDFALCPPMHGFEGELKIPPTRAEALQIWGHLETIYPSGIVNPYTRRL